jgi:hypothetical protein
MNGRVEVADLRSLWTTSVSANFRMFGLHDPTCEEVDNFSAAVSNASSEIVGWAPNALMVEVVSDLVLIEVEVELLLAIPSQIGPVDLVSDGELALPGGLVSIPQSVDEDFQRGVALPSGPGTYGLRVLGYGRSRAQEIRAGVGDPAQISAVGQALLGVERYRLCLWQVSSEPCWPEDDEE